jgi:hypothetical protein
MISKVKVSSFNKTYTISDKERSQAWWYTPTISATQEEGE